MLKTNSAVAKLKKELDERRWADHKTNQGLRRLYKELEKKNEDLLALDRLKSRFLATVSHELRTPVTVITQAAGNMASGVLGPTNDKQKRWLNRIDENAERLARLLNDILDLSKLESHVLPLQLEPVDIRSVVSAVVANLYSLAKQKAIALSWEAPQTFPKVLGSSDRLQQVVSNLVSNAVKFTPEGGTVTVSVTVMGENCRVAVVDDGPGIASEHLEKIFEPFVQLPSGAGHRTSKDGIGLGLSICREIVNQHAGRIWAESGPSKGSRFVFSIPFNVRAQKKPQKSLLIIGGNDGILPSLRTFLEKDNVLVSSMKTPAEALRALEENKISANVILVGDGFTRDSLVDLIRGARRTAPNASIVILSQEETKNIFLQSNELGGVHVLSNSFTYSQAKRLIDEVSS